MPCSDITDILQLRLDSENRIAKYWLRKRSCGGAVGERSLIFDWASRFTADEFVRLSTADLFTQFPPGVSDVEEYLLLKHFFALHEGIAVLLGEATGRAEDFCTVETISHSPLGVDMVAHIRIDAITEQIRACGRCSGCSVH